ncbi:MAG TPA: methylmalonyl-CoA mutase subunit beta [Rhodoblastus sp.]|nr:methylmalonyl-CoA mutase subunit beta [Rhodoblastus sp.]
MTASDMPYASAFPPVEEARWRELATAALKGAPFERLVAKTYDGTAVQPLYAPAAAAPQPGRAHSGPWAILARVDAADPKTANELALTDLENGAGGLQLAFAGSAGAYGFGLPATEAAIEAALAGGFLDAGAPLEIDAPGHSRDVATALAAHVAKQKVDPKATLISFGLDPLGGLARGAATQPFGEIAAHMADAVKALSGAGFAGPFCVADARIVHAAGGTEAQELAYAISAALAYLRALEDGGLSLDAAAAAISFRIAVDADEFLGVAKLRALRRLWARVEEACGLAPSPALVHAETAWRMMTRRDPYVNMLRATVAVFSAAIGGADRISVLPFTQAVGLPDEFARRVARNTQLVLLEESNLDKVADPTAGAGGFEVLTAELCDKAWALVQQTEKAGGLAAQIASGALKADVEKAAAERAKNVARRKDALTGASEFPNIAEKPVTVLAPAPTTQAVAGALAAHRLSEPYEALRDKSDALAAKGKRPSVFLANIGPIAAFTARATFAKNFFEAGGVEAPGNDGFASADAAAEAYAQSGAPIACICSSDAVYAEQAEAVARALKAKGAKLVILAGRPGDKEAAYAAAGVGDYIFAGADVLGCLNRAWTAIA